MSQPATIPISSVITVISVISLIVTYLLGELSNEDRMARDRIKPIYKKYLKITSLGLIIAVLALVPALLLQFNFHAKYYGVLVIALFSISILIVSTSTLLLSYELMDIY